MHLIRGGRAFHGRILRGVRPETACWSRGPREPGAQGHDVRFHPVVTGADRDGGRYAPCVTGPHRFIVTWGRMGRFDFVAEVVESWDPDEAMATAAELHPELPRPRVAVLASHAGPPASGRRTGQEPVDPG